MTNLPGARISERRGYDSGPLTLRILCASAPAGGWADGVEEILLGRATQLAREALPGPTTSFVAHESTQIGVGFEQRFDGSFRRDESTFAVHGRHWLGFAGEPRVGVLCTVACTEPGAARACAGLVEGVAPVGAWLGAPPPNLLARTLLAAAANPWGAAGALMLVSVAVAALVIARRPRPSASPWHRRG